MIPQQDPIRELHNRVALLTGSTRGIGLATARMFLMAGSLVVLNSRDDEFGKTVAGDLTSELELPADRCIHVTADANDPAAVGPMVREVLATFDRLDVLFNNVGGPDELQPFRNSAPEDWYGSFDRRFWGKLHCIKAAIEPMIEQGYGSIVNIVSDAGRVGTAGGAIGSASYGGLIALTKSLAREFARYNVRINNVSVTLTAGTGTYESHMAGDLSERIFRRIEESIPLGILTPPDIAAAVVFLASPAANKITGQTLSVNGGMSFPD